MRAQTLVIVLMLGLSTTVLCSGPYTDAPFLQLDAKRFLFRGESPLADWSLLPFDQVLQVVEVPDLEHTFLVLTRTGLYGFDPENNWVQAIEFEGAGLATAMAIQPSNASVVAFAAQKAAWRCFQSAFTLACKSLPLDCSSDPTSVVVDAQQNVWIGADRLYLWTNTNKLMIPIHTNTISSMAYSPLLNSLAVGTATKLWRWGSLPGRRTPVWHFYRVNGLIDDAITSLHFDETGALWIGNKLAVNIQNPDLTFVRLGGDAGGIPYGNITAVASRKHDAMWFGTSRGAMRYNGKSWRYFLGPRWLPDRAFGAGNTVVSISVTKCLGQEAALVVTKTGVAWFRFFEMTLKQKADYFQSLVLPYHDRYGLTASCVMTNWGEKASSIPTWNENDGLWSGMYLASQALRYAVTRDPQAKSEADRVLSGLELLNNVTGVKGLFARSVLYNAPRPVTHLPWYNSTTMPGWIWEGDTSSDEVTGQLMAYLLYVRLVAQTPSEKMKGAKLLLDAVTYIITNDYYLMDVTGQRTSWGVWNPSFINDNPNWFDQRGVNSMQILSWIAAAQTVAAELGLPTSLYTNAISYLIDQHTYDVNIINAKIPIPNDNNFSDDELTFLPYLTYLMTKNRDFAEAFFLSINRTFDIVKVGKSSLWTMVYAGSLQSERGSSLSPTDAENALWTLKNWPLSWIDWPTDNTQRWDTTMSMYTNRKDRPEFQTLLPWDERTFLRWNGDPFEDQPDGSGYTIVDPTAWLLPYWMARFYDVISS